MSISSFLLPRRLLCALLATFATLAAVAALATSASAANYVALGDSYAAGPFIQPAAAARVPQVGPQLRPPGGADYRPLA